MWILLPKKIYFMWTEKRTKIITVEEQLIKIKYSNDYKNLQ